MSPRGDGAAFERSCEKGVEAICEFRAKVTEEAMRSVYTGELRDDDGEDFGTVTARREEGEGGIVSLDTAELRATFTEKEAERLGAALLLAVKALRSAGEDGPWASHALAWPLLPGGYPG